MTNPIPIPFWYYSGTVILSLDATISPADDSVQLAGNWPDPPNAAFEYAFLGGYAITASVTGRHRNLSPELGHVAIGWSNNPEGDLFPSDQFSSSWVGFVKPLTLFVYSPTPETEMTLFAGLEEGELEITNISLYAHYVPAWAQ